MGKWIALFVLIISSSILGFLYYELEHTTSETLPIVPVVSSRAVRVFHSYDSGEHRYVGEIKFPHSCYELRVSDTLPDVTDVTKHMITVTGIDRMLDMRLCAKISTRYQFDVLITAPEHITISLVVDGDPFPVRLIETAWQSPAGHTVTTPEASRL